MLPQWIRQDVGHHLGSGDVDLGDGPDPRSRNNDAVVGHVGQDGALEHEAFGDEGELGLELQGGGGRPLAAGVVSQDQELLPDLARRAEPQGTQAGAEDGVVGGPLDLVGLGAGPGLDAQQGLVLHVVDDHSRQHHRHGQHHQQDGGGGAGRHPGGDRPPAGDQQS